MNFERWFSISKALLWFLSNIKVALGDLDEITGADLFSPSKLYEVLGPTIFPKPNDMVGKDSVIILEPTFGEHRPNVDAVLAYAEGYVLPHYLLFVNTLVESGFDGDIVLAVSSLDDLQDGVEDFLRSCSTCVIYAIDFTCFKDNFQTKVNRTVDNGGKMSFQMCQMDNIYGLPGADGHAIPVPDPRSGRVVATSRYELYWIWCTKYEANSWIMLVDARDAYFQSNPFLNLPRSIPGTKDGILYFFGENTNATRLGKSVKNRKWLERAYSKEVAENFKDKPTICSGSTMGEQVALQAYLRGMISEWDETHILQKGADQGFHNYLYYSGKLRNIAQIRSIRVFDQGHGIINNLGALRDQKLSSLGAFSLEDKVVYNWDGKPSPVCHQFDRDSQLFHYIKDSV